MSSVPKRRYSAEEYLAIEEAASYKSEFYAGEIFAMTGATPTHNTIATNLIVQLYSHLQSKQNCKVLGSDQRIKVDSSGLYTYPDVVVACDAKFDRNSLLNPKIIFEILSKSTELYDRGQKFEHYRTLPSLQEYFLVSQAKPQVERFIKQPDGSWSYTDAQGLEAIFEVPSLSAQISVEDVYRGVDFSNPFPEEFQ